MSDSSAYFGIELQEIRKFCVICPVSDNTLFTSLGKSKKYSGLFAKIINYEKVTIISTKNNFLVGDIVLQLKNTSCENIILFGSCGGAGDVKISDKIIVKKVFNFESFSEMLEMKRNPDSYYPSASLVGEYLLKNTKLDIQHVKCATTSSLVLEKKYKDWFSKNKINAIDMECSSVFSASCSINKKAIAMFYVTDIIGVNEPFGNDVEQAQKSAILKARHALAKSICNFINDAQQHFIY
jgi:nucleoside phosphorylase